MKNFLRVGDVAKQLNISSSTVRHYANSGQINFTTTPHGQRVFTQSDIDKFVGKETPTRTNVYYIRSSNGNTTLMKTQEEALRKNFGEPDKIYKDKGSGLNENRKQLQSLLIDAKKGNFTHVCITQKDRLTRFGYSYLVTLLAEYGVTIEILYDKDDTNLQEELLQDFMNLLASFSGKFYRLRGYEQKRQLLNKAGEQLDKTN